MSRNVEHVVDASCHPKVSVRISTSAYKNRVFYNGMILKTCRAIYDQFNTHHRQCNNIRGISRSTSSHNDHGCCIVFASCRAKVGRTLNILRLRLEFLFRTRLIALAAHRRTGMTARTIELIRACSAFTQLN